jgi:arginine N-succinyltransferase
MSFIVRPVRHEDVGQLVDLARQFGLLNLPGDRKVLTHKIEKSVLSFQGKLKKKESEYVFVLEDVEEKLVVGSSLILAKHGTDEVPHSFFKIIKRNHFSEDLGIGFIHQVLRFQQDMDGPSEIGGLLVDKIYRRRPERLGKQISLSRFLYVGLNPEKFEERILCELTPPLTDEGRSEFWEALGRRFTGLPYQEADLLSQSHREFISSLFPEDDIYLCLLDSKARSVLGRVGEQTKPAQHLLESIGFEYLDEVDPFDGGPHFGVDTKDIKVISQGKKVELVEFKDVVYKDKCLVGADPDNTGLGFRSAMANYDLRGHELAIPTKTRESLGLEIGQEVFWAPFEYSKSREQT